MRREMPVGLALEAGKDAVGGGRGPLEDGAVATAEVGGDKRDLFLLPGRSPVGLTTAASDARLELATRSSPAVSASRLGA